ncbi:MBL fold metallo-hydrolase [Nitratireductor alexandrii]|uniref:MBL fold metallo-hydrolase n=1 Tax=Nitratireductor alexandrii TaxID=2448161 RepID=UPI000FDB36CE|nr:MBL fold metallo-hydrolase [Nitratireductor alexandrii]
MPTRRDVLAGIATASALALARPALAAAALSTGAGEISVVSDGRMSLPLAFVFPDIPAEERNALLAESGMSTTAYEPDCNVTLLRAGDRLALFDAGAGPNFLPTTGKLLAGLEEAGVDPAEVTDLLFTHAHPDHLWGVLDDFDDLAFPEATPRMARAEWDFWRADDTLATMPEDRKSFVVGAQNRMAALEDRIALFAPGEEVFPGVEAVDTAGHTPGHVAFMIHGGDQPVLIAGDALTNAVSFRRPALHSGSDQDREQAAQTRLRLLDRMAGERARLIAFHLPYPGMGTVERKGEAYRFAPLG